METTNYLDRFLEPVTEAMPPEFARVMAGLEAEVEVLREKANAGTLSPTEDAAYKKFVGAVDVISILQMKARRFLNRSAA